jgi:hypothetical protein
MKCPECQADNPDNKKFCRNCGAKLPLVCPQCGSEICLHDHFCGECGHDLKRLKPALYTERSQPKSYTPKYLESAAEAGTVLVSKNTCKLVKDVFEFEYAGKLHLKGKKALQEAYKLIRPIGVENQDGGGRSDKGTDGNTAVWGCRGVGTRVREEKSAGRHRFEPYKAF